MGLDFDKPKKTMQQISKHHEIFTQEKKRIIDEYKNAFSTVSNMSAVLERSFKNQINSPDPIPQGDGVGSAPQPPPPRQQTTRATRGRGGSQRGRGT